MPRLEELLDLDALRRYDGLALDVRYGVGDRPGDRRFPGHPQPSGAEIESYVRYHPGDDVRHLDWNAFGRLDTLLIRRFTAEREVPIRLLVDCSASMTVPAAHAKHPFAIELAMALGYLGLAANDAVQVVLLTARGGVASPVFRQRAGAVQLGRFLAEAAAADAVDLGEVLAEQAERQRGAGVAIVLSDFMVGADTLTTGVRALRSRNHDLYLVQLVAPGELDPSRELANGVLLDVESGRTHAARLTPETIARYQELLGEHFAALAALATTTGARYGRLTSDLEVADAVTRELVRLGLVRRR